MTPIILDQEFIRNGSITKHQLTTTVTSTAPPVNILKQALATSRRHRPSDILVLPQSPPAEDIIIVRMAPEAAILPSPRFHRGLQQQRLSIRAKPSPLAAAQKRPRILLSTKSFKWVKTDDAVWVKVPLASRKRRIVLKTKEKSMH
ncbi:uncharacterized protein ColSpa_02431 [Colletotrichum spaethianum]|uniref:Uncharacterized protein n=1 Tax=Colletotrichum spaethianum TaxID=700344 RepID=A0AA37LA79_9PEZI|nr:uncharacterized protein ColSpa_02431 [Colletotrichum spaethianum]GKT42250.1 hypothetical protein ColSpa_02431 [Colletotrichum spaethianum]